jgi:signal transduction histidine kinase/ActR/RegA family two-component response regulator
MNLMIQKIPIKTTLIVGLLISGLIPTLVVSFMSYSAASAEMKDQVFRQLESIRNIKKEQIHNFFAERTADISAFSMNPYILKGYEELEAEFKQGGKFKGLTNERFEASRSYTVVHERYFPFFRNLLSLYGYNDLFLLDPLHGDTIFSVRKEPDFGIRISEISSSLREVWTAAVREKGLSLSDTRPYPPSNNTPAQFIAAPLLDNDEVKGVIAVRISTDSIDEIMKGRAGMWQTGETYLVGQDKRMRSNSYLDSPDHSILASFNGTLEKNGADTVASQEALQGIEDKKIITDYRGRRVLSAYTPINIKNMRWALIAEVDEDEINAQISDALNSKLVILTGLSVLSLFLLALVISIFINKEIRGIAFQLEKTIDNILRGKLHSRIKPSSAGVDFRGVMARANELQDAFVNQMDEKRKLEDQIQGTQRLEAIGTLAGGIAHDFNNILTSMHAYALIVQKNIPSHSAAEENMNELILSIRRASELVEQILTFSCQVKREEKLVDISKEITESIKLFKSALPRNIMVKSHLDPEPLLIKANPSQIRQVIMNLYTNAYQAMQGKGGTLTISTEKIDPGNNLGLDLKESTYCKISVKDTGHGMDQKTQKRIFEPFFTTKAVGKGTGMGLSVVHGIVRRCGGAIKAESSPGKGARFDVYLPLAEKVHLTKLKEDRELAAVKGMGHILFVDDDAQICDSQKKALELLGYTVTAIQDSRMAEEIFSKNYNKFDLLILDLNMPHLNGFELAERIIKVRPDIPIILSTGYSELIDSKKIKDLGIHSLLLKPYKLNDISRCMAKILKSKKKSDH